MAAPHPRMHGATHVPGGPDPIPGLTIPRPGAAYVDVVKGIDNLVAYWRMGEPSGVQLDYADNPDGDLPLQPQFGASAGQYRVVGAPVVGDDGAFLFNVDGGAADFPTSGGDIFTAQDLTGTSRWGFPNNDPFTVSFWFQLAPQIAPPDEWGIPDTASPVLMVGTQFEVEGWGVLINPEEGDEETGKLYTLVGVRGQSSSVSTQITSYALPAPGVEWWHVAMVYTGSVLKLYLNGVQTAEASSAFTGTSRQTIFVGGGNPWAGVANVFLGGIDEVAVWNVALTAAQIHELAAGTEVLRTGSTWHHGSGTPVAWLGGDTDYYLDTATGDIWFKVAATWAKIWDA